MPKITNRILMVPACASSELHTIEWGDISLGTLSTLINPQLMFPVLNFERGLVVNSKEDNSLYGRGFPDVPKQVTKYAEKSFPVNFYSNGFNTLYYWAFGIQLNPISVCAFIVEIPETEPVAGATYQDTSYNNYVFNRKEVNNSNTLYIFTCDTVPGDQEVTLSKIGGTGSATLSVMSHSGLLYESVFLLDPVERHITDFRTEEQITGYEAGMVKNKNIILGCGTDIGDFIYNPCMCKKFDIKSTAGDFVTSEYSFLAKQELRGDAYSDTWSIGTSFGNAIAHHQVKVLLGASESTLVALSVSDFSFGLEIPLDTIQDTGSGISISEPRLEGKYKINLETKLSRYAAETYQTYRDNWSDLVGVVQINDGYNMFELLFNNLKISQSGPDSANIESEPLKLESGFSNVNNFTSRLYRQTLIYNSPIVCRVRNLESSNHMFTKFEEA